jgi:hypothetical protein
LLIKLIECIPKAGQVKAFSKAQAAWTDLAHCEGFYGQFGGWESRHQRSSSNAIVMAFWQNKACIDRFMLTAHDKIFDANKQVDTYSQCRVNYFSIKMPLLRLKQGALAVLPIEEAGFVHVTDYLVKPEDKGHFFDENSVGQEYLAEQATAWQAGHNSSGGFLGGYIAVPVAKAILATNSTTVSATHSETGSATNAANKVEQPLRYLIITFWATALAYQQHQAAMTSDEPNAGRCPTINPSISQVFSIQFDINRAWDVIPDKRAGFTVT